MPSQDIKEILVEALAEILTPKKDKKAKTSPKYVMVIDGKVMQSRPSTKAEVLSAAQAIILRRPEAKIEVYKFHSNLAINLPVAGMESDVETEVEGE